MPVRRVLAVVLALGALSPASASAATSARISLPTPKAGDVTLARALVVVTSRGHRLSLNVRATNAKGFSAGVRAAEVINFPVRGPRQVLVDMFVALGAATGTDFYSNPSAMRLRIRAGGNKVALARLLVVPNAFARTDDQDSACGTLSEAINQGNARPRWLMGRVIPRWKGVSPRTFVFGAYGYGCVDGIQTGLFAEALLAPLSNLQFTWRHLEDGTTRICEYITGAPGTRGTIELIGPSGSLGAQPYVLSSDGYALAAWTGTAGTYRTKFRTSRANGVGGAFAIPPPPAEDGAPPPIELQLGAGGC